MSEKEPKKDYTSVIKETHEKIKEKRSVRRARKKKAVKVLLIAALCSVAGGIVTAAYYFTKVNYFNDYAIHTAEPDYSENATCSFYIYLCGSNLESKQGLAGKNIDELLKADIPDNVNVVIETGGAEKWHSHGISDQNLQRYIIKDKKLMLIEEKESASMGSADTFADFLKWGREQYPADRNFLVMWDHGGSSAEGLCYDEKYDYDCLDRSELKAAFSSLEMEQKYDMILLDACYMGSIETADIFQDYFHYMIASQKVIPGGGLDYTEILNSLTANDDKALGKIICDSFYEKCGKKNAEADVQLSLYRLAGTENVIKAIDSAGNNLLIRQKKRVGSEKIISAATESIIGNAGEKINVVDLTDFMKNAILVDMHASNDEIRLTTEALLPYQVKGQNTECNGISLYYPVNYDEVQLKEYLSICPIKNYSELLEKVYHSVPEHPIQFENPGSVSKDGTFEVSLTEDSRPYVFTVNRKLWKEDENSPGRFQLLGTDDVKIINTYAEQELYSLSFKDDFDGKWYYLGGSPLLTSVTARRTTTSVSAPVNVNGNELIYTFSRTNNGKKILLSGTLGTGINENGMPSRDVTKLKKGDKVRVYAAADESGDIPVMQNEFTVQKDGENVQIEPLPAGKYRIQYVVSDILCNTVSSDYAIIEITGEGRARTIAVTGIEKS